MSIYSPLTKESNATHYYYYYPPTTHGKRDGVVLIGEFYDTHKFPTKEVKLKWSTMHLFSIHDSRRRASRGERQRRPSKYLMV
jgi:hypothetical protein